MLVMNRVARLRSACVCVLQTLVVLLGAALASQARAQSVTYQYDASGRISTATYANGTVLTYTYDNSGNRLSTQVVPGAAPTAPASISSSSITSNSAVIGWTAATDGAGITGYAYSINGGAYSPFSSYSGGLTLNLSSLAAGETYTVTVEAEDANGIIGAPATVTFTLPPTTPGTPTASTVTGSSATVSWAASSSSAGITGYSYQLNGGAWSNVGNVLSIGLSGLAYGTLYTIGVRAQDGNGNFSAVATGTFTTGPSAPGTPTASSITGTSATVSWTQANDPLGITGYSYQVNGGTWSAFSNVLSVSLTGLAYGTTYTVAVHAQDNAGNLGDTATGTFTTPPSAPGAPIASNITGTTATVSWTPATGANGIAGYRYRLNGGSWSSWNAAMSVNLTGLSYGTHYTIDVEAEDAAGSTGDIATGTFSTLPSTPGGLAVSNITGTSATVSWAPAQAGSGITGYSYQLNGGSWSGWSAATTVSLTGLAYGTNYTVGVRAQDQNGSISYTATVSFTTAPSAPGVPTFSSIGPTTAHMTWGAATSAVGVSAYHYSINGGTSWTSVGGATSANLSGLSLGTTYTALVQAQAPSSPWGVSSSKSFTTASYYTDTFTVTSGSGASGAWHYYGYNSGSLGSISPTITTNGLSIVTFEEITNSTSHTSTTDFVVSGFSSDPGSGWLSSVSIAATGQTYNGSSASYTYSSGTARWIWAAVSGPSGTVTVVHK